MSLVRTPSALAFCALCLATLTAHAQTPMETAFTYQGQLKQAGTPFSGLADFEFRLWDDPELGSPVGATLSINEVSIDAGLFTVPLDFGVEVFNGDARWLEIAVRAPAGGGNFTTLSPRQPLSTVPYALQARGIYCDPAGNVGIGHTAPQHHLAVGAASADSQSLTVRGYSDTGAWKGGAAFGYDSAAVIMGELNDVATIGGHSGSLNAWANLAINSGGGNVGIGTTAPTSKLSVNGDVNVTGGANVNGNGTFGNFVYATYGGKTGVKLDGKPPGWIFTFGPNGNNNFQVIHSGASVDEGLMAICDTYGQPNAGMYSENAGHIFTRGQNYSLNFRVGIGGTVDDGLTEICSADGIARAGMYSNSAGGTVWGTWKWFRVDNPFDANTEIWYGCLEGPEQAAYVRGTAELVDGKAAIELPEHFRAVARADGMTVHLTALSAASRGLAVLQKSLEQVLVAELNGGTGTYEFDYFITAPRQGSEIFDVVRPLGGGPYGPGLHEDRPAEKSPVLRKTEDELTAGPPARAPTGDAARNRETGLEALRRSNEELRARLERVEALLPELTARHSCAAHGDTGDIR